MKIISIDPDLDNSGYAIWEENSLIEFGNKDFLSIIELFKNNLDANFIIEAGYLNKSVWHGGNGLKKYSDSIAKKVGENHGVAKVMVYCCNKIVGEKQTFAVRPLAKDRRLSTSKDGKISHKGLESVLGIKLKRTNQDNRDAILLGYKYKFLRKAK